MIQTAFSTVACPDWTLQRVARAAGEYGFDGVDLRSWGHGGGPRCTFACDPGLTSGAKVQALFDQVGVHVCGLSTDVRFDAPIFPPVLGNVLPKREESVGRGKHMVELASDIGAQFVRVFCLEISRRERRGVGLRRICNRLAKVCDHARNRDVRLVIENEGSFASAWDLIEIIDHVGSPQLGASYNLLAAVHAGDDVAEGVRVLGQHLMMARVRDCKDEWPVPLGEGELPCAEFVKALGQVSEQWSTHPWVVYNWDRAGVVGLEPPEVVLPGVPEKLAQWAGGPEASGANDQPAWTSTAPAMVQGF